MNKKKHLQLTPADAQLWDVVTVCFRYAISML